MTVLKSDVLIGILESCGFKCIDEENDKFAENTYFYDYDIDSDDYRIIWTKHYKDFWIWFNRELDIATSKVETGLIQDD